MNSVLRYIERTCIALPDNIAVDDGDVTVSYREFREKYTSVATAIMKLYGGMNKPVMVYLPKSSASVISFMGILASGNMYVPIDFKVPLKRFLLMIEKIDPVIIITDNEGAENLKDCGGNSRICLYNELVSEEADFDAVSKRLDKVIDTDPAYIMHTSGSTGVPKGVVIAHRGIENYANWLVRDFKITEKSVLGLQSGFHFDNSVFDMYTCFFTGATLVIIPEVLFMYPQQLLTYIKEKRVSCIFWVPTVMINVANSGALSEVDLPDLQTVTFAGEVMPNKQLNIWRRALPGRVFANLYGPTEITVDCTFYVVDREFEDSDKLPIGVAVPNTKVFILNEKNELAKVGEEGELCVAGCCLALGYYNDKELTDKVFVQNPLNTKYHELIYRTGDIAYTAPDGLIMYVGRRDNQFKLRGNRIELGDVESAAMCISGVEKACALYDSEKEEIILVAESKEKLVLRKFNMELSKYVPKYMLPQKLVVLEQMPLTPNRKTDRKLLFNEYVNR